MAVPEATVNNNNRVELRKDHIGLAGKVSVVKPVPEAETMERLADRHFRHGVLSPDASHHTTSRNRVHHIHFNQPVKASSFWGSRAALMGSHGAM